MFDFKSIIKGEGFKPSFFVLVLSGSEPEYKEIIEVII
nr:MAG TPA: hypothetical protein [Caudoviricetes sp.]